MPKKKIISGVCLLFAAGLFIPGVVSLSAQTGTASDSAGVVKETPVEPAAGTGAESVPATVRPDGPAGASAPADIAPVTIVPRASFSPPPAPVVPENDEAMPVPEPVRTSEAGGPSSGFIGAVVAVVAGVLGFGIYQAKTRKKNPDNGRCGNIRELLEQKKRELEEMIRGWPEEKIKEMGKKAVLGQLKKDKDAKDILDAAGGIKEKYDKLQEAIELLQKKYDLCMLKLPSAGDTFRGIIVENSLKDKKILEHLRIEKTSQSDDWLLHAVAVSGGQIEKLGQYLDDGPWYMHFRREGTDDVIVVFKEKSFRLKSSDTSTWVPAREFGVAKGIPEEQLDFSKTGF